MISAIVTAFVSFASTNIDDIFVLMLFFSQVGDQLKKRHIIIGQYLGITTLLFISIMGSIGLNLIPQKYTGLLGIIPILLGIKEWLKYRKDKKDTIHSVNEVIPELQSETVIITITYNPIIENSEIDTIKAEEIIENEAQNFTAEADRIPEDNVIDDPNTDITQIQAAKNEK